MAGQLETVMARLAEIEKKVMDAVQGVRDELNVIKKGLEDGFDENLFED